MSQDQKLHAMLRRDAESNYSPSSAAHYRQADELGKDAVSHTGKCEIVRELSRRFDRAIDVLDLGCGTGRYFHCAENVKRLIGVDPAHNMLLQARQPVSGAPRTVHLVRSTLHEVAFRPSSFDMALCIGVFGEWCPFDGHVLRRIADMLRPDGAFFCTVVEYQPTPLTWKRRVASAVKPLLFGPPRRYLDFKLREFTASERTVRTLAAGFFEDVEILRRQSPTTRIDLHCALAHPKRAS